MARFSALLDACVLVPVALADIFLRLAEAELYRPLWSERILSEMVAAIGAIHPGIPLNAIERRAHAMQRAFEDSTVHNWEPLEDSIELPDLDDRHVVAAAIVGRADVIVTKNLKDCPRDYLATLHLDVMDPDEFLLDHLDLAPKNVVTILNEQSLATRSPSRTPRELLDILARSGAPRFSREASAQLWRI